VSNSKRSNIAIIGTAAFLHASKLLGSYNFELCLRSLDIQANSAKLAETPDLSNIPFKYHEFADVFSKTKAEVLAPHRPYNLKINLEEGAQPPVGLIYSLSASEQEALKNFIEKNLNTGFIQPTLSPHNTYWSYWSYLLRRKMVHCASMLTSAVLTASPRRIVIHSCLSLIYWTHLAKLGLTQR